MTTQNMPPAISCSAMTLERNASVRAATVRKSLRHILSVSSVPEDHQTLRQILRYPWWNFSVAANCVEARERLTWNRIAVVICESGLPDRGWKALLDHADEYSEPLTLIVTS